MEQFLQFIDQILQSQAWRFISTHFYWVDWITVCFVLWGLLHGIKEGFVRTLAQTLEAGLIAYAAFFFHEKASLLLHTYLPFLPRSALPASGYLVIILPVTILVMVIDGQVSQLFHTSLKGPIRVGGGAIVGVFYRIFLWSFISQPLIAIPNKSIQKSYEKGISISGPLIKTFAPQIYQRLKP